jgi:hypothetical protein
MDQLAVAGATDTVKGAGIHRDGCALLELTSSPGLWHEDCLEFLEADRPTQQMAMLASERCMPAGEANSRNKIPTTEVVAVRRLYWESEPRLEVLVSIGKPEEIPGPETWFHCPIQTSGLGKYDFLTTICGVDAFQAIELALRFVDSRLADIDAKSGGVAYAGSMGLFQKTGRSRGYSWRNIPISLN